MSSPFASHSIYRFSNFEVDARSGEVRKNGVRLKIQDQPLQILLKLLECADQVVTREELRSTLWTVGTFVDFDNGLNMAMKRLREVLGDLPERPIFIETVPRRGYRFIAPVQKLSSEASPQATISEHARKRIRPATLVALLAAVVGILCAVGTWFRRSQTDAAGLAIEVVPLAGLSGLETTPAFSADGSQVAFSLGGAANSGIYTTVIGGERPLRLTSDGCCPRWSPDGSTDWVHRPFRRWLGYQRNLGLGRFGPPALLGTRKLFPPYAGLVA
ncbi:MAG TPA: winged helix-turn-helix domain-containing protein [Bryobacteraceae bacterium]|jgi:DNA-binding winged helix-turn-helix (wHTH) protein